MGYSTKFKGVLKFTKELTIPQLTKLKSFLGEDCRDHPEWHREDLTYIDLKISKDYDGLEWDGSEKTYDLVEKTNLIITEMKKDYPDFGLDGSLLAQGEDNGDIWKISIVNGVAVEKDIELNNDSNIEIKAKIEVLEKLHDDILICPMPSHVIRIFTKEIEELKKQLN